MPHLFNLVATHQDGRRTRVNDWPLTWKQAQQAWLEYVDAHSTWYAVLEQSITVEPATFGWLWIDTALALTPNEHGWALA